MIFYNPRSRVIYIKMAKYSYNLDVFYREDAVSYYLLGVFITDGNVFIGKNYKKCTIVSKDKVWLEAIRNLICPALPIRKNKDYERYDVVFCSTAICDWLIERNCKPNKSLSLTCPPIPNRHISDFLRGVWDGDGSIAIKDGESELTTGSLEFANAIAQTLYNLGISSKTEIKKQRQCSVRQGNKIVTIIPKSTTYRVRIRRKADIRKLLSTLYYPNNPLSLQRKEDVAINILNAMR